MNKLELISILADQQGLTKAEAKKSVDLFFEHISDALIKGDRVEIRGWCSFKVKEYESYTGRNPKSGEPVKVKSKRLPFFKVGSALKHRVDGE